MEKINRDDAEILYAKTIMERGNPEYFIYLAVDEWSDDELLEAMEEMELCEFEILEEE